MITDSSTCPSVARQARTSGRERLGLVLLAALALVLPMSISAYGGSITVPLGELPASAQALSASINSIHTGAIEIPGFAMAGASGSPALPSRIIYIALPPEADLGSVTIETTGLLTRMMPGTYDISPVSEAAPLDSATEPAPGIRNAAIYGQDEFWPAQHLRVLGTGHLRTWKVAAVEYTPYSYNPVSGRLRTITSRAARLSFTSAGTREAVADPVAREVSRICANASEAATWYHSEESQQSSQGYAIITTQQIVDSSTKLRGFANLQFLRGFDVHVATENDWGGGAGDAAAENIRQWLAANYLNLGLRYVLLIGNPDPANGDVPMKMLWPRYRYTSYREAPSDYYYADLTGDWDIDKDGFYGELPDDFSGGGIDRLPEVYVGRIPFYGSIADLDRILQKTMDYESQALGDWASRAILAMRPLDSTTPAYRLGENIRQSFVDPLGFTATRLYQSDYGLVPPPDRMPCTYDAMASEWSTGAGFVCWMAHGGATSADAVMNSSLCSSLDDSKPSIVFQASCYNGSPESPDNLAYSLLRNGAVATVAASRACWYYIGESDFTNSDSAGGIAYQYAGLVMSNKSCGQAISDARLRVPACLWQNHLVFNLYGDPSAGFGGPVPGAVAGMVSTVTGEPVSGAVVETADRDASALTADDGSYLLRGLAVGAQQVVVSAEGFCSQTFTEVPVSHASTTRLDAYLSRASYGAIAGRVCDAYGAPLPDAVVRVENTGLSATSGADGSYLIADVPVGHYRLVASKHPLTQETIPECAVAEGSVTVVDVMLACESGSAIVNGGFEEEFVDGVAIGWTAYSTAGYSGFPMQGPNYRKYGKSSQALLAPPGVEGASVGICQAANVLPGKRYSLVVWARDGVEGEDIDPAGTIVCRLGYDPTGGSNPTAPSVVWRACDPIHDVWRAVFTDLTPHTTTMTVFLEARRASTGGSQDCCAWFDGAALIGPVASPSVPLVSVPSLYMTEDEALFATWSCPDLDIASYEWAVGSTADESGVLPGGEWASAGLQTAGERRGVPLANGDAVKVIVRARNQAGGLSGIGASQAIRVVAEVASIADAKSLPDGVWVRLKNVRVSRMGLGPVCYVQEADRSAGIEAVGDRSRMPYVAPGTKATLIGRLASRGPMRIMADAELMPSVVIAAPRPIGVRASWLNDSSSDYTGMLIMVIGRVTNAASDGFAVDDGSVPGGIPVIRETPVPVDVGGFVRVIGIWTPDGLVLCGEGDLAKLN